MLNAGQIQSVFTQINKLRKGSSIFDDAPQAMTNDIANAMAGALRSDMRFVVGDLNHKAIRALQKVRAQYQRDSQSIEDVGESVMARVFGQRKIPINADEALTGLGKKGESTLRKFRLILEEYNPTLLRQMQGRVIRDAVQSATEPSVGTAFVTFSPAKLATALSGKEGNTLGSGLLDATLKQEVTTALLAARTMLNAAPRGAAEFGALAVTLDDIAINVVSQSPFFIARLITRAATGGRSMETLFSTRAGREALLVLKSTTASASRRQAAAAVIAMMLSEEGQPLEDVLR